MTRLTPQKLSNGPSKQQGIDLQIDPNTLTSALPRLCSAEVRSGFQLVRRLLFTLDEILQPGPADAIQ
jgi:hypothetical protein